MRIAGRDNDTDLPRYTHTHKHTHRATGRGPPATVYQLAPRAARYAGWTTPAAKAMLAGGLEAAAARVAAEGLEPEPKSGRQERLENLWNRYV